VCAYISDRERERERERERARERGERKRIYVWRIHAYIMYTSAHARVYNVHIGACTRI